MVEGVGGKSRLNTLMPLVTSTRWPTKASHFADSEGRTNCV